MKPPTRIVVFKINFVIGTDYQIPTAHGLAASRNLDLQPELAISHNQHHNSDSEQPRGATRSGRKGRAPKKVIKQFRA